MNHKRNKLNIVHIASADLWAGAEVRIYNLARQLHRTSDTKVSMVLFNHSLIEEKLRENNIEITVIDETKLNGLRTLFKLITHLRLIKPDIIHTHGYKENIIGSIASIFVRASISVRTEHGAPEFNIPFWKLHKLLISWIDVFCGRYIQKTIIAVSEDLSEVLSKLYKKSKIRIIENGIDIDAVIDMSNEAIELPGPNDAIKCAIICRLVDVKRPDIFVQVADYIIRQHKHDQFRFYIFGDGPLYNEMSTMIKKYNIDRYVYLMGFKNNVPAYLSVMDLSLITSDHEGLPMNLLESLALQVPVISHAVGGIPKVIQFGNYGTLVNKQDVEKYATAIEKYLTNKDEFTNKSIAGFKYLQNHYSIDSVANKYIHTYKMCMGGK